MLITPISSDELHLSSMWNCRDGNVWVLARHDPQRRLSTSIQLLARPDRGVTIIYESQANCPILSVKSHDMK